MQAQKRISSLLSLPKIKNCNKPIRPNLRRHSRFTVASLEQALHQENVPVALKIYELSACNLNSTIDYLHHLLTNGYEFGDDDFITPKQFVSLVTKSRRVESFKIRKVIEIGIHQLEQLDGINHAAKIQTLIDLKDSLA